MTHSNIVFGNTDRPLELDAHAINGLVKPGHGMLHGAQRLGLHPMPVEEQLG
jgi:hypothetical protein